MNLLLLHSHDTGRYLQPYGFDVPTPRIQRLAEEGVLFRQAFSAAPSCSPARAALMTGRYPHSCGMHGLASKRFGHSLDDYSQHLARFLGRQGFETALAGIQHEGIVPWMARWENLGYDRWLNHKPDTHEQNNQTTAKAAADYLREVGRGDRPFFLSAGFFETHRDNPRGGARFSFDPAVPGPEELDARYVRPPLNIPDTPLTRRDFASYRAAAANLDRDYGLILDALDEAGLADETLVLLTTDHGLAWPGGKCNLTDAGIGVAMILRGPSGSPLRGGQVIDAMVSHIDFYPTLCDLLGLDGDDRPSWMQGTSMLPLFADDAQPTRTLRDEVFAEQGYHALERDAQRCIRTTRYKYIRREPGKHIRIVDPGPTNDWFRGLGYAAQPEGEQLLYDLFFDPTEACNLASDPDHAETLADLSRRLNDWMEATDDPFRHGADHIPPPPVTR